MTNFSSWKCTPIVGYHLLFSDRKRIITSLRGRGTDMPFRLCHECRSLRESLRNNFVLCLSFMFPSRACFVQENLEMAVLWSALNHGCSYSKYDISVSISFCIHGEKTLKRIKISISSCGETDEICIAFFARSGCWIKHFFLFSEKKTFWQSGVVWRQKFVVF